MLGSGLNSFWAPSFLFIIFYFSFSILFLPLFSLLCFLRFHLFYFLISFLFLYFSSFFTFLSLFMIIQQLYNVSLCFICIKNCSNIHKMFHYVVWIVPRIYSRDATARPTRRLLLLASLEMKLPHPSNPETLRRSRVSADGHNGGRPKRRKQRRGG